MRKLAFIRKLSSNLADTAVFIIIIIIIIIINEYY